MYICHGITASDREQGSWGYYISKVLATWRCMASKDGHQSQVYTNHCQRFWDPSKFCIALLRSILWIFSTTWFCKSFWIFWIVQNICSCDSDRTLYMHARMRISLPEMFNNLLPFPSVVFQIVFIACALHQSVRSMLGWNVDIIRCQY